jgi:predicted nucleic acid-binding protein
MPSHLLDTSVYCQPLKPRPLAEIVRRWNSLGDSALVTSVIADAEVQFGIHLKRSPKLAAAYQSVLRGRIPILPVDDVVGESFALLKELQQRKGQPRADLDLLIAATARAHQLVVATLNVQHFEGLDGVTVEDWSKP